jgi:glycosyltransferase involved in cell wall biosynthesis
VRSRLRENAAPPPPAPDSVWDAAAGFLDWPPPQTVLSRDVVSIYGWSLFPASTTARVELWLGEHPLGRARLGLSRADVRELSESPRGLASGFELRVNLAEWPGADGETEIRIVATSADGERFEFPPSPVTIAPAPQAQASPFAPPPTRTPLAPPIEGLRALVFTHQLDLGGAQLYLVELLRELLRLGAINPTVVSAYDGPVREQLEDLGIPVHISSTAPVDELSSYIGRTEELLAWAEPREFDLALVNTATTHSLPGAEVAAELGIPAVWLIHESFKPAVLWAHLDPEVRQRAEGTLSNAAAAIFEAEATRQLYEPLIGADRTFAIPYSLDPKPIEAERANAEYVAGRREIGIAADADVVLCLGTVEPRKAQIPLAQAFELVAARHPRAELLIVGCRENPYSRLLEEVVETLECGERIRLVPITPDVHRWFGISDILVCASDIESLPRTVLEAMAWEKPVLSTSIFGLPELIDDGETGWLCDHSDIGALAEGLDRALSAPEPERRRLAAAARERLIAAHDPDAYARRIAALLAETAGDAPHVAQQG